MKEKQIKYKFEGWMWIIFAFFIFLIAIRNFIGSIILLIIFFICKPYFVEWALEIKKDPKIPFFLVLFFGLLGFLGYWLYYKSKIKKR